MDSSTDYGELNKLAGHKVNTTVIAEHWDDLLRLAGSLKLGTVQAPDILLSLTRGKTPTGLGRAAAELGRIAKTRTGPIGAALSKTLHLLEYIQDEDYRRRILIQLNRGELRNSLARVIHHGQRGEVRERYKESQEDHLSALGLIVNAVVVWNSRYLQAVLDWLEVVDESPKPEDVARLSPLRFEHINMLGRYHFDLHDEAKHGGMRPLRDPDTLETFEELWQAA